LVDELPRDELMVETPVDELATVLLSWH
jgi:hypothetical protein